MTSVRRLISCLKSSAVTACFSAFSLKLPAVIRVLSPTAAFTLLLLVMMFVAMPMPTLEPMDRLMPPARDASRDLSMDSMATLPPSIFLGASAEPPSTLTWASPLLVSTLTAPPSDMAESLPATEPETAWVASLPAKSPDRFWVSLATAFTSPSFAETRSPSTLTLAVFLLTLTATPRAMELAFSAKDMAAPVPWVWKLPAFSATALMSPAASMAPTFASISWPVRFTPTAAATCTLLPVLLPGSRRDEASSVLFLASSRPSLVPSPPAFSLWV